MIDNREQTMRNHFERGFTLIELMVTVAIVGILAGIAYPSYKNTVLRSHRSEAHIELTRIAGDLEKCFTRYMKYNDTTNCTAASNLGSTAYSPNRWYRITGTLTSATQFSVTATANGAQSGDTACATITLNEAGTKTAMKSDLSTPNNTECWK